MPNSTAGKWAKTWVGGYHLSTYLREVTPPYTEWAQEDDSGFTEDHRYIFTVGNAMANINGYFSQATAATHEALKDVVSPGADVCVTTVIGDNATPAQNDMSFSMLATQGNYMVTPDPKTVIGVTADFWGRGLPAEAGILLADISALTASADGTSSDNTASSNAGGVGYIHVTGISAGDTLTVVIEDSTDDAAWVELLAFTIDGSALTSERVAVSGTVNRYLRYSATISGTDPSFDFAVLFHRK